MSEQTPLGNVRHLRPAETRPCGCPVDGEPITPCRPTDPFHDDSQHWLLFDGDRQIVGCHCGFKADVEADCGWGDSVVQHLLRIKYVSPFGGRHVDR